MCAPGSAGLRQLRNRSYIARLLLRPKVFGTVRGMTATSLDHTPVNALWAAHKAEAAGELLEMGQLLARFAPAYGGDTWKQALAFLDADPVESGTVDVLSQVLASGHAFTRPVRLDRQESQVGNGMHRIAAAVRAGATHIPVTFEGPDLEQQGVRVVFTATPSSTTSAHADPGDDVLDLVFTVLRSFPLYPPAAQQEALPWVECLAAGAIGPVFTCEFDLDPVLAPVLVQRMARLLDSHGHSLRIREVEACVFE